MSNDVSRTPTVDRRDGRRRTERYTDAIPMHADRGTTQTPYALQSYKHVCTGGYTAHNQVTREISPLHRLSSSLNTTPLADMCGIIDTACGYTVRSMKDGDLTALLCFVRGERNDAHVVASGSGGVPPNTASSVSGTMRVGTSITQYHAPCRTKQMCHFVCDRLLRGQQSPDSNHAATDARSALRKVPSSSSRCGVRPYRATSATTCDTSE